MSKVPIHYVPNSLSTKNATFAKKELKKSRNLYKKGIYYQRKKVKGYKSKKTSHKKRAAQLYGEDLSLNGLAKATKCTKSGLQKIIKKGMGAYLSSGSRPSQTPHSWGIARLYSAITGGPASKTDKSILQKSCKSSSKALHLAQNPRKPYKRSKVSL